MPATRKSPPGMRLVLAFLLLFGLWLLLVDGFAASELAAGAASALVALFAGRLAQQHESFPAASWTGLAKFPLLVAAMVRDSVAVLGAALLAGIGLRRTRAEFRRVEFSATAKGSSSQLRRAIAVTTTSFAPNRCVIGFDTKSKTMLLHQFIPGGE